MTASWLKYDSGEFKDLTVLGLQRNCHIKAGYSTKNRDNVPLTKLQQVFAQRLYSLFICYHVIWSLQACLKPFYIYSIMFYPDSHLFIPADHYIMPFIIFNYFAQCWRHYANVWKAVGSNLSTTKLPLIFGSGWFYRCGWFLPSHNWFYLVFTGSDWLWLVLTNDLC